MTVIQPPSRGVGQGNYTFGASPRTHGTPSKHLAIRDSLVAFAVTAAIVVAFSLWVGISLASLIPSMLIGLLIGWIRQWRFLRRGLTEPLLSAVLGAEWNRSAPLLTAIDIAATLVVGYAVGAGLSWAAMSSDVAAAPLGVLVAAGGGSGGGAGGDPGVIGLLLVVVALVLLAAAIGAAINLMTAGLIHKALSQTASVVRHAAAGAATSVLEGAAADAASRTRGDPLLEAAVTGALTGAAVCIVVMIWGLA